MESSRSLNTSQAATKVLFGAFEKDVRASVKALTAVFEPAIILVMGVIIGTVVLSMLMAIFSTVITAPVLRVAMEGLGYKYELRSDV